MNDAAVPRGARLRHHTTVAHAANTSSSTNASTTSALCRSSAISIGVHATPMNASPDNDPHTCEATPTPRERPRANAYSRHAPANTTMAPPSITSATANTIADA